MHNKTPSSFVLDGCSCVKNIHEYMNELVYMYNIVEVVVT